MREPLLPLRDPKVGGSKWDKVKILFQENPPPAKRLAPFARGAGSPSGDALYKDIIHERYDVESSSRYFIFFIATPTSLFLNSPPLNLRNDGECSCFFHNGNFGLPYFDLRLPEKEN